ncbi:MAG: hypothetical protein WC866_03555 [Patescibacteria group bacterium]
MSSSSYRDNDARYGGALRSLSTDDPEARRRAEESRRARIASARSDIGAGHIAKPVARDERQVYDPAAVKNVITKPSTAAQSVHIILVDNSGSNEAIASHLRASSGYLLPMLRGIDAASEAAWVYFSDHSDGADIMQEIDFIQPNEAGDKTMLSTLRHVRGADGGDAPEAIECALWRACDIDFAHVPKAQRSLYLVTDVVAHGMGMRGDNGCPDRRDWRDSLARVEQTYSRFTVIGCGADKNHSALQPKFLKPERVAYDLIDLSAIRSDDHRMRITGNALLFLIARNRGPQTVERFLMALFEKWLSEPIFGANTELNAKEAVRRFGKYLEISEDEREALMDRIFA